MGKREAANDPGPEGDGGWGDFIERLRKRAHEEPVPIILPPAEEPPLPTGNCPRCNSRQWVRTTGNPGEWKCYECPVKTNPKEVIAWCLIAMPDDPIPPAGFRYAPGYSVVHPGKNSKGGS